MKKFNAILVFYTYIYFILHIALSLIFSSWRSLKTNSAIRYELLYTYFLMLVISQFLFEIWISIYLHEIRWFTTLYPLISFFIVIYSTFIIILIVIPIISFLYLGFEVFRLKKLKSSNMISKHLKIYEVLLNLVLIIIVPLSVSHYFR